MAAALLHEPEILFLDEPTSGADPLARRDFWRKITGLAERGVTIVVTTHMMEEAEYCDRVAIMDSGRILAEGTPVELRRRGQAVAGAEATMEDAFIAVVEEARSGLAQEAKAPMKVAQVGAARIEGGRSAGGARIPSHDQHADGILARARRIWALVKKEGREVLRDPSSMGIGIVLPVMLILLFGFGLSLDVMHVPVAVVMEDASPQAQDLAAGFSLSPYFEARLVPTMTEAREMMLRRDVDGIVRIRPDFSRRAMMGDARVQVLVHGTDANTARIIQTYAQGAVAQWAVRQEAEGMANIAGPVGVQGRMWFNEAAESRYFLVPGLIVLIMTLIGALLTALVMAREWERGTFEALFVTPIHAEEILLGKTIPYFILGMIGLALCLGAARFLFHVPFRGSVAALVGTSVLYLLVALSIGLLISSTFKSQFVASQITLLVTFLPAVMLSGFMFDLRSMPMAVRALTYVLPARYYVALLQTIFLAGDVWGVILPNALMLAGMAAVLMLLARRATQKTLA
jgi:ABC-2 type transport system permease protein